MQTAEVFQDEFEAQDAFGSFEAADGFAEDSGSEALEDDALESYSSEDLEIESLEDESAADPLLADEDAYCSECEALDEADEFGFQMSPATGLWTPAEPRIIHGPAAMRIASRLNPFVLEQLGAEDADAFFGGLAKAFGGVARGLGGAVSSVARAAPGLLRQAAPLISRALPMVQQVAGKLGPWGALVSAGLGAGKSLLEGKGLGGALQGAMSGALSGIPGAGAILGKLGGAGNLIGGLGKAMGGGGGLGAIFNSLGGSKGALGSVLGALAPSGGAGAGLAGILGSFLGGGEGADDDADLDALADLVDARRISPAIALPIGASLAARTVARKGCSPAMQLPVNSRTLWKQGRAAQRTMLHAAAKAGGSPGRQLRLMRAIARLATYILRQRRGGARQLPPTVRFAAARILRLAGGRPGLGAVPPQVARQKLAAREAILRKVPVSTLCRHTQPQAYA